MKIFLHLLVSAVAIIVSAYILPGVHVGGFMAAFVVAVVLGAINGFLRPILIVLTFPLTVVTFGLFLLVINTLLIMLAAMLVSGFDIDGFWWAFIFGIVLTIINSFLRSIEKNSERRI